MRYESNPTVPLIYTSINSTIFIFFRHSHSISAEKCRSESDSDIISSSTSNQGENLLEFPQVEYLRLDSERLLAGYYEKE